MSRKQAIYTEMLSWAIPHVRNVQSGSFLAKALDCSSYAESELVHNLYQSLLEAEFVDHDIYFLNVQAKNYVHSSKAAKSPCYDAQCALIQELLSLVPSSLQGAIKWQFPSS